MIYKIFSSYLRLIYGSSNSVILKTTLFFIYLFIQGILLQDHFESFCQNTLYAFNMKLTANIRMSGFYAKNILSQMPTIYYSLI